MPSKYIGKKSKDCLALRRKGKTEPKRNKGMENNVHPASFRDPSGFVFWRDGKLFRQVNRLYQKDYDCLMQSGLYSSLVQDGLMVAHEETKEPAELPELAYRVLKPETVGFISYPYEWCFGQLKGAALLTLHIQRLALEHGMTLKDASAYNIQFLGYQPILIDTLSFEEYHEGEPWVAYRQFCQHFLAPLALMAFTDVRLSQLLRVCLDGIPLDLTRRLLPWKTRWNFGLGAHIHVHALAQKHYAGQRVSTTTGGKVSKMALQGLIDNLEVTVKSLFWKPSGTEWADYYQATNYSDRAFEDKKLWVREFISRVHPSMVWDLGANTGIFSRIASGLGAKTIAFDIDPAAVELNYQECVRTKEKNLLPLVLDLTNPSPALGWANTERQALIERGEADMILALALVHHLTISNNVPLQLIAKYFARLGEWLVVEFVPKSDSQVQRLLASRKDIFTEYHQQGFEYAFGQFYETHVAQSIGDSGRVLYLMRRRKY